MTCDGARRLFEFGRPGVTELDAADIAALESHLAACDACARFARAERWWDDQVARAMQAVPDSAGGPVRLLAELGRRRRDWWRLTALKVAVGGWAAVVGWSLLPAPALDPWAMVAAAQDQAGNADAAGEWLKRQNPRFEFPPRFRAKYLAGYQRQPFGGVTVPVLTFVRHNTLARVAVVAECQFRNLASWPDGPAAENSACAVNLLRDPRVPGVVFVVEVVNGPVEPLFSDDEAPAA